MLASLRVGVETDGNGGSEAYGLTMADQPTIYIICSNQDGSGKTLLARLLADYLLLDGHDPFLFDADFPNGALRAFFPGRTGLVDLDETGGQTGLFRRILASPGRDYVIDLRAADTVSFFRAAADQQFKEEARRAGFRLIALFVLGSNAGAMPWAAAVESQARLDLMVLVQNHLVHAGRIHVARRNLIELPLLDPELAGIIAARRFSFRKFILGEETRLPPHLKVNLNAFLLQAMTGLHNIRPVE